MSRSCRSQPRPLGSKPEPFRSIRFVPCLRCMGHGFFWTDPLDPNPTVAFSRVAALDYLAVLKRTGQISYNQNAAVESQILSSDLPEETPLVALELIARAYAWEEKRVELASIGRTTPEPFVIVGSDVAEALHEFLLTAPEYPHLRATQ